MDEDNKQRRARRNREPVAIDTTVTGNHPSGNTLTPEMSVEERTERIGETGLIWIDQEDHAKQGYARREDLRKARAAPDHPYIRNAKGGGESQ